MGKSGSEADDDDFVADQWISLQEAVDQLASNGTLGYIGAKANIVELILDGRLELRCQKTREEADIGVLRWGPMAKLAFVPGQKDRPFRFSSRQDAEPMPLPSTFWVRSTGWKIDPETVDWANGTIVARRPAEMKSASLRQGETLFVRRAATGCIVKRASLPIQKADLQQDSAKPRAAKKPKTLRNPAKGAPSLTKFSDEVVIEKLKHEIEAGDPPYDKLPKRGGQAHLERRFLQLVSLHDHEFASVTHARRKIPPLMKLWREKVQARSLGS